MGLNSNVHELFRRVRYRIPAEFDRGTTSLLVHAAIQSQLPSRTRSAAWGRETYFFMIMYLNALPSVWSSCLNSNEAAVS